MSNEFKLVPARILLDKNVIGAINFHCGDGDGQFGDYVDGELWVGTLIDDDGKEVHGLHLLTSECPEEGSTTLAEFAAPQPPALGGEPDTLAVVTLGCFSSEELGDIDIEPQMSALERIQQELVRSDSDEHIELIDRAHLAPLQAEIERLKDNVREVTTYRDNAIKKIERLRNELTGTEKERDQFKAQLDQPEALLPKYQRGSTGLSGEVERLTLIARQAAISSAHRYSYMPALPEDAQNWKPHEWVLEAMRRVELDALSKPVGSEKAKTQDIPSRTINLSGCELTESDLLESAVRAVRGSRRNTLPRWALVRDAFCVGSGVGNALCRRFGFDPEEILKS